MMKYCSSCGNLLEVKCLDGINEYYCSICNNTYYDHFNVAVSMIVKYDELYLLIKQYNKDRYILVAGYTNKGETLEDTVKRELKEETGLTCKHIRYNMSKYYEKSNTLMVNYIVDANEFKVIPNLEIDSFSWFTKENVLKNIAPNSLAREFYLNYLRGEKNNEIK